MKRIRLKDTLIFHIFPHTFQAQVCMQSQNKIITEVLQKIHVIDPILHVNLEKIHDLVTHNKLPTGFI